MTTIMLIRHGDTDWNVEEIFRGRVDVELNEIGVKQAELLAKHLTDERIVAIYSSPLKRALKTAETIAKPHSIDATNKPTVMPTTYIKPYQRTEMGPTEKATGFTSTTIIDAHDLFCAASSVALIKPPAEFHDVQPITVIWTTSCSEHLLCWMLVWLPGFGLSLFPGLLPTSHLRLCLLPSC